MLDNCFRFAPRDSIPGLIAKICKYLKDHPGWSEEELAEQIKKFISSTGVESFNGREGAVTLDKNDVNNLKIASAYFAEVDESIDSLNLVSLYNQGVRFVFTDFNSVTSGYNLAFVLDYLSVSGDVVYYPMSTGSSGSGNIVSVNGKTGVVELSLSDIVGTNGVQVKLCTEAEFMHTNTSTWNTYYNEGYRIVGVVNSDSTAIDHIYILKQDENNHTPIGLSTGTSDAYTPTNPPPYPVTSVNGKTGSVTGLYDKNNPPPYPVNKVNSKTGSVLLKVVDVSNGNSADENAYMFIDESDDYPDVIASDSSKLGGKAPEYYLHPRNLLDNSDFTNLVAQAGIGGNHGAIAYAADRWILDSGTVSYEAGVGLTLNGTIRQKLELPATGRTSAFVGMASGDASISYADGAVTITSGGGVIKWAALYEGSYTDENLPPFVAPDPVLELLKCQRYCFVVKSDWASVYSGRIISGGSSLIITVTTPVEMYGSANSLPSVVVGNLGNIDFFTVSGNIGGATNVSVQTSTNNRVSLLFETKKSSTPNTPCVARFNTVVLLSHDL